MPDQLIVPKRPKKSRLTKPRGPVDKIHYILCERRRHGIALKKGRLVLLDHDKKNARSEAALYVLSGRKGCVPCYELLNNWRNATKSDRAYHRLPDKIKEWRSACKEPVNGYKYIPAGCGFYGKYKLYNSKLRCTPYKEPEVRDRQATFALKCITNNAGKILSSFNNTLGNKAKVWHLRIKPTSTPDDTTASIVASNYLGAVNDQRTLVLAVHPVWWLTRVLTSNHGGIVDRKIILHASSNGTPSVVLHIPIDRLGEYGQSPDTGLLTLTNGTYKIESFDFNKESDFPCCAK